MVRVLFRALRSAAECRADGDSGCARGDGLEGGSRSGSNTCSTSVVGVRDHASFEKLIAHLKSSMSIGPRE
jgi:hypothetical protein